LLVYLFLRQIWRKGTKKNAYMQEKLKKNSHGIAAMGEKNHTKTGYSMKKNDDFFFT